MSEIWSPTWQAAHAYSVMAVVRPSTFGGYTWRCTTAGTSGNSEPTWPDPLLSPTVSDGTVTWSVGTGFRQAVSNGIVALVTAFAAANPTIVRSVKTRRPSSFAGEASLPVFYIGDMSESVATSQGVRTRTFDGFSAYLVDQLGTITDSDARMDFAADVFADLFTLNLHAASGRSLVTHTATRDTQEDDNGILYPALEFTFGLTEIAEGRS